MRPRGTGRRQVLRSLRPGAVQTAACGMAAADAADAADGRDVLEGRDRDRRVGGSNLDRKSLSRKTHRDGKTGSIALRERLGPQPTVELAEVVEETPRPAMPPPSPRRIPRIPTARAPKPRNSDRRLRKPTGPRRRRCAPRVRRWGTRRARTYRRKASGQRSISAPIRARFYRDGTAHGGFSHG